MSDKLAEKAKNFEAEYGKLRACSQQPLVLRLDGKNFGSYTAEFERPFDNILHDAMVSSSLALAKELNASIIYTQSDETSLILLPKDKVNFEYPFGGKIQKLCSISSSIFTLQFAKYIKKNKPNIVKDAFFDCRVISLPNTTDVRDYILNRTKDCVRNSVFMFGRSKLSHKQMFKKSVKDIKAELEINNHYWNDLPMWAKHGSFIYIDSKKIELDTDLEHLPEKHKAREDGQATFSRKFYSQPQFNINDMLNMTDVLIGGNNDYDSK